MNRDGLTRKSSLGATAAGTILSIPVTSNSLIPEISTVSVDNLWEIGEVTEDEDIRRPGQTLAYPIKLVGVAFAAQSRPLFLTERHEHKQTIGFKDVSVFDHRPSIPAG